MKLLALNKGYNMNIKKNILDRVNNILPEDVEILYITKFGSKLYGTDTPESDDDYRGIFIASHRRLLLKQNIDCIERSTGNSHQKNTKDDIDISLISIHKFFSLLKKGDVTAVDLLFSMFREDTIIFQKTWFLEFIKDNYRDLITKQSKAFVNYCLNHARKNGIKAHRLQSLLDVYKIIDNDKEFSEDDKSAVIFDKYRKHLMDIDECKFLQKEMNGVNKEFLSLFGKLYQNTLSVKEFKTVLMKKIQTYGARSKNAIKNIDFRALSHSCRVIYEICELLDKNYITFPFDEITSDFIRKVKLGKVYFENVEKYIENHIDLANELEKTSTLNMKTNVKYLDNMLLSIIRECFGKDNIQNI